jgi:hypothetical protein
MNYLARRIYISIILLVFSTSSFSITKNNSKDFDALIKESLKSNLNQKKSLNSHKVLIESLSDLGLQIDKAKDDSENSDAEKKNYKKFKIGFFQQLIMLIKLKHVKVIPNLSKLRINLFYKNL